ncbi:MAG: hypothetical protein IJZ56_05790 [Oscillospiraceae bacterium]|nr:hypothetical protein [Oscillospiraceae bacterium]
MCDRFTPKASALPVAVPGVLLADGAAVSPIDRGYSFAPRADFVGCALHAHCGGRHSGRCICRRQRSHHSPN